MSKSSNKHRMERKEISTHEIMSERGMKIACFVETNVKFLQQPSKKNFFSAW